MSGGDAAVIAKERSLDQAVLERWMKYLKPTKERRVHLEASVSRDSGRSRPNREAVPGRLHLRGGLPPKGSGRLEGKADEAKARGEQPPAPPKFMPGDNRFFTEVGSGKGPLRLPEKEPEKVFSRSPSEMGCAECRAEADKGVGAS